MLRKMGGKKERDAWVLPINKDANQNKFRFLPEKDIMT